MKYTLQAIANECIQVYPNLRHVISELDAEM